MLGRVGLLGGYDRCFLAVLVLEIGLLLLSQGRTMNSLVQGREHSLDILEGYHHA